MLSRSRRFRTDVMAAFVVVILLLTLGMSFALRRTDHVSARQLSHVRFEEREITLVERLRWSAEVFVSVGRAYLISGEATQLANLTLARADFDAAMADLEQTELSPVGVARLQAVRAAAMEFRAVQQQLVQERSRHDVATIVSRFETELLPVRVSLRRALDQLVGHKTAVIERVYVDANRERRRLVHWMYGLLAALALGSLGVAWLAARGLARTYRREAEALNTARTALRARDDLMGIVAHDLRTPLGAIMMRAELLQSSTADPHAREQAAAINTTATRIADLIKTMLDVTVIEAGQFTVHKALVDVDRLLGEELEMHSMSAAAKQVQLERHIAEPGLKVLADRERIVQVISNLLGNAIKFTPTGGRVALEVERVADEVMFSISDTGPGIPEDNLPHVFDRLWKDETRGTKGTGLGLFIAKSIIDAHGGTITVESSPGAGATFRFTLLSNR